LGQRPLERSAGQPLPCRRARFRQQPSRDPKRRGRAVSGGRNFRPEELQRRWRGLRQVPSQPSPSFVGGGRYRVSEIVLRRDSLSDFNDWCKDFSELRALILQARAAAMNDAEPARTFTGWTTPASPGAPLLLHRSGLAPPTPCRSPGAPVRKLARSICV
jgi:hypothetical protein